MALLPLLPLNEEPTYLTASRSHWLLGCLPGLQEQHVVELVTGMLSQDKISAAQAASILQAMLPASTLNLLQSHLLAPATPSADDLHAVLRANSDPVQVCVWVCGLEKGQWVAGLQHQGAGCCQAGVPRHSDRDGCGSCDVLHPRPSALLALRRVRSAGRGAAGEHGGGDGGDGRRGAHVDAALRRGQHVQRDAGAAGPAGVCAWGWCCSLPFLPFGVLAAAWLLLRFSHLLPAAGLRADSAPPIAAACCRRCLSPPPRPTAPPACTLQRPRRARLWSTPPAAAPPSTSRPPCAAALTSWVSRGGMSHASVRVGS